MAGLRGVSSNGLDSALLFVVFNGHPGKPSYLGGGDWMLGWPFKPTQRGDDAMPLDPDWEELLKISLWLDINGWDKLMSPEFDEWLKANNINKSELTISACRMPDWA